MGEDCHEAPVEVDAALLHLEGAAVVEIGLHKGAGQPFVAAALKEKAVDTFGFADLFGLGHELPPGSWGGEAVFFHQARAIEQPAEGPIEG